MSDTNFDFFDVPATAVQAEIALMNARADTAVQGALDTIAALGNVALLDALPSPPAFDLQDLEVPPVVSPTGPNTQIFGSIDPFNDPALENFISGLGIDDTLTIQPGSPPPTPSIAFPPSPGPIETSGAPILPVPNPVSIPTATLPPDPPLPPLDDLVVPPFAGINEPVFVDVVPVFDAVAPTGLQYTPSNFVDTLLTQTKATIALFMQGGTGIPIIVQDALFQAGRVREEQTALAAEQDAFDTWAGRNFSMPPGMLVEAVTVAQERSRFAANALSRDILSKAAVWEIENLRHYVAQGVSLVGMLMNQFNQVEQRVFDAAKAQADIELKIYELATTLYNIRQTARRIGAEVYKARWDGEVAKVTAFRATVDAVVAKGQINDQRVRVYLGMWEGVKSAAQVFETRMRGAQIASEQNKTAMEGYAAGTQGYAALIQARKVPSEVYAEEMKGAAVQGAVFESQVKGFLGVVQAQEAEATVKQKLMDLKLGAIKASIDKYTATLTGMRDHIQAQLANVQAKSAAYVADTGRYREEIAGANQTRALTMQTLELRLRNNLEYYSTQLREFDTVLARQIERARIIVEALKGAGQIGASLAAGAMSAIHVQAAIHGSGSVASNVNTNSTHQISSNVQATLNKSYSFDNPEGVLPDIPIPQLP